MALEHRQSITVEEYFLLERNDPDARYEYVDGYINAMAGGTFNHDTIKSNIQRILWGLLRGGKCRVYSSELKDRTWKLQNYTAHPTIEEYLLVSSQALKIELYRKEQNKWVYSAFGVNDDIDLASLGVHFSVAEAYEGINPEEDFSSEEENGTFPGR